MTDLTDDDLRKLLEMEAKATRGPWTTEKPDRDADGWSLGMAVAGTPGRQTIYAPSGGSSPFNDQHLIAAARNAIRPLVEELLRRRAAESDKTERATGLGEEGLRDPEHPCADFSIGDQTVTSHCETDGHYLCAKCKHRAAERGEK